MEFPIYQQIISSKKEGKKLFSILVDPDKTNGSSIETLLRNTEKAKPDYFLVGGSLLTEDSLTRCITQLKSSSDIPIILFPGSILQVSKKADAILFLSLISGRNPDLLIGHHVISAPYVKASGLEVISTGYMLIDSGRQTTASYISNTTPIPSDKSEIAACTAIAGEMLGLKLIYMDGGSGALNPIPTKMISDVTKAVSVPVIVGGGIKTPEKAFENCQAGADMIVIGNALEKDPTLMHEISNAIHSVQICS